MPCRQYLSAKILGYFLCLLMILCGKAHSLPADPRHITTCVPTYAFEIFGDGSVKRRQAGSLEVSITTFTLYGGENSIFSSLSSGSVQVDAESEWSSDGVSFRRFLWKAADLGEIPYSRNFRKITPGRIFENEVVLLMALDNGRSTFFLKSMDAGSWPLSTKKELRRSLEYTGTCFEVKI